MYYLMNKDTITASISRKDGRWKLLHQNAILPTGKFEINEWLEDRKAFKHNHHLKRLMENCGCETTEGFIRITHAASINDSYWLKKDDEEISWDDVSFYRNEFNDTVSKLAFEGLGLYGIQMSSTSPELTTDGSFRKCWRKEDGNIYLYKRGPSGAYNAGLEPYCEALASEIINYADPESVRYTVVKLHKETATKCRSFTNEETGFVPLRKLVYKNITMEELLQFFDKLGCLEKFQRMLVLDAITFNVDRHLGNMGLLVDNDTQEITGIAPNFDFNLSMLPYVTKEEFDDIGRKLLDYGPQIGNDFTRMGQQMLTSKMRSELINLQGFEFTFRGNQDFEPWRVQKLEKMVHQQIKAILKGEGLQTKDVFVPKTDVQQDWFFDNAKELKLSALLKYKLDSMHVFSSVMEEIGEDNHVSVRATVHEREDFMDIIIYMDTMEISCEKNGIRMPEENISAELEWFHNLYKDTCIIVDGLYENDL